MKKNVIVLIAAVIVVLVGGALFFAYEKNVSSSDAADNTFPAGIATSSVVLASAASDTAVVPPGESAYANEQFHFSLFYPDDLSVKEYKSGQSLTVTFQDTASSTGPGFQIFAVPYDEPQVTKERFELDEPSGVMEDPTNVVIDGTQGTMFYSSNTVMGDTREVWFLRDGILYEVTTYKALDSWLAGIMQTWQFI